MILKIFENPMLIEDRRTLWTIKLLEPSRPLVTPGVKHFNIFRNLCLSNKKKLSNKMLSLCFLVRYDERIDRVETRITARLRDQLGTAKNANEMFRIFSRFNALFVRPHIRGAIREYQTQLIQRVKDDIEALHDKFKV